MFVKLLDAFKLAFDSLVRTYSPMLAGAIVGWLAIVLHIPVPDEVKSFVVLLIATLFAMLWYGILRLIEIVRGRASKLLGLGLVKSEPNYGLTLVKLQDGTNTFLTRAEYRDYLDMVAEDADRARRE